MICGRFWVSRYQNVDLAKGVALRPQVVNFAHHFKGYGPLKIILARFE